MHAIWTPTAESFFGRVKGDYLDGLYCELFAVKPSDAMAAAFAKKKKGKKSDLDGGVVRRSGECDRR